MSNVLVFGGAFNPIHLGHIAIALRARQSLLEAEGAVYEIWFTPSYYDTFREKELTHNVDHRLEMLKIAIKNELNNDPNALICTLELESKNKMGTYELMKELSRRYPKYNFKFLLGADTALHIDRWRNSRKLRREFSLVVVARNIEHKALWGTRPKIKHKVSPLFDWTMGPEKKHTMLTEPPVGPVISSTKVRELVAQEKWADVEWLLPGGVLAYIRKLGLYKGESNESENESKAGADLP